MADRCIDGTLTTGTQAGTVAGAAPTDGEWANAAHAEANIQAVYDGLAAGDTLHATRTQTLTAPIDIDQASGAVGNPIRVLGYNYNSGAPLVDGTPYVIDANSAAANCFLVADKDYWHIENVEFKNSNGGDLVTGATSPPRYWAFINCDFHDSGASGIGNTGGQYFQFSHFYLCRFYSNADQGAKVSAKCFFDFCTAHTNAQAGFYQITGDNYISNSLSYNNVRGIRHDGNNSVISGCTLDDNSTVGIAISAAIHTVANCRITNSPVGIDGDTTTTLLDYYNFNDCTIKTQQLTAYQQIRGVDTRTETGEQGYIDAAGGNYGLTNAAAARRQAVTL